MIGSLLDTALDLSVIGGYTNVGFRIRRRGWKPPPRMEGKVVLITGATSGLGLAAAGGFAEGFTGEAQRLDVLVNNAGVLSQGRKLSADGIEA